MIYGLVSSKTSMRVVSNAFLVNSQVDVINIVKSNDVKSFFVILG